MRKFLLSLFIIAMLTIPSIAAPGGVTKKLIHTGPTMMDMGLMRLNMWLNTTATNLTVRKDQKTLPIYGAMYDYDKDEIIVFLRVYEEKDKFTPDRLLQMATGNYELFAKHFVQGDSPTIGKFFAHNGFTFSDGLSAEKINEALKGKVRVAVLTMYDGKRILASGYTDMNPSISYPERAPKYFSYGVPDTPETLLSIF